MRRERVGESRRTRDCEAKSEDVSAETSDCADLEPNPIGHLRLHHEFFRRSVNKIEAGPVNDFEVRRESLRRCS